MSRPIVIIESPFAGDTERNLAYLRAAMRDCLLRGEAPYASHALYTQPGVLRDDVAEERALGIKAGFAYRHAASRTVVYTDLGVTHGMNLGIADANNRGQPIEYRTLPTEAFASFAFAPPMRPESNPVIWKGTVEGNRCARLHADGTTVPAWGTPRSAESMLRQLGKAYATRVQGLEDRLLTVADERDALRERVATLERNLKDQDDEHHGHIRKSSDHLRRTEEARDTAESRVKELEAQLRATEREKRAVEEHAAKLATRLEDATEALAAADVQHRRASHPAPAPAQDHTATTPCARCGKRRCDHDLTTDTMTWRCVAPGSPLYMPTRHGAQAPVIGPLADGTAAWDIQRTEWSTHEPPPSPAKSLDDTLAAVDAALSSAIRGTR